MKGERYGVLRTSLFYGIDGANGIDGEDRRIRNLRRLGRALPAFINW